MAQFTFNVGLAVVAIACLDVILAYALVRFNVEL